MEAAGRAANELNVEIKVIKKTSAEYRKEKESLPCPSVVVNGRVIARNGTVSYQALKTAIMSDSDIPKTMAG